ncbi:MOSC domain-containing protein [Mesorhizobium sp. J428]|uniref:MOSC domain-containing protein n=1 Tax=Mesorhizobium sp. J428 TaxID=2898440 RepID=UPI0021508E7A|nr:MOSC N-terminal beta barrel domain-containing protein [Mesorhizobium sp. J428]MCR5858056.1 MOSC domain-containing protein [Mesorhizobium sp. J428]
MNQAAALVASLAVYPLKSARGVPLLSARVEEKGLADDRAMMVVDGEGKAITARAAPALMQVRVVLDGDEVVLFAPGRSPFSFRRSELEPAKGPVAVWGSEVSAQDGGSAVAAWLSEHLDRPARLVLQDGRRPRMLDLGAGGIVSLADTAPLLLTNTASLAEINDHLHLPAEMERFRPNVVLEGASAFEEDGWGRIRIGEVEFEVAGPCDRCVMITLDPETGEARSDREPLALLGKQRRGPDGKVYFGQFLIPRSEGRIHVGDCIEVAFRQAVARGFPGHGEQDPAAACLVRRGECKQWRAPVHLRRHDRRSARPAHIPLQRPAAIRLCAGPVHHADA